MGGTKPAVTDRSAAGDASPTALLTELGTSTKGLATAEVTERQASYGPNTLEKQRADRSPHLCRSLPVRSCTS